MNVCRTKIRTASKSQLAGPLGRRAFPRDATVTDLSRNGCFVLTGGKLMSRNWSAGDQLTETQIVNFWAEVVDAGIGIGFALKFNSSSPEDEATLAGFLEKFFRPQAQNKS